MLNLSNEKHLKCDTLCKYMTAKFVVIKTKSLTDKHHKKMNSLTKRLLPITWYLSESNGAEKAESTTKYLIRVKVHSHTTLCQADTDFIWVVLAIFGKLHAMASEFATRKVVWKSVSSYGFFPMLNKVL